MRWIGGTSSNLRSSAGRASPRGAGVPHRRHGRPVDEARAAPAVRRAPPRPPRSAGPASTAPSPPPASRPVVEGDEVDERPAGVDADERAAGPHRAVRSSEPPPRLDGLDDRLLDLGEKLSPRAAVDAGGLPRRPPGGNAAHPGGRRGRPRGGRGEGAPNDGYAGRARPRWTRVSSIARTAEVSPMFAWRPASGPR